MFKDELIIIRHARSKHNIRESECMDDGISDFGIRQAKNLGIFLESDFDLSRHAFYTSPFLRCLQTVSEIVKVSSSLIVPKVFPFIREYINHSGREVWVPNRKDLYPDMNWSYYPDDGETYDEEFNEVFLHRIHDAYHRLEDKSVVITHGLPALLLLHMASEPSVSHVPIWDYSLDNASISVIKKGRVVWHGRNLYHEYDFNPENYRKDWTVK